MARGAARAFVVMAALTVPVALPSAASAATLSSALELVREAHVHEQERDDDLAVRRYMEALALDPTCGEAYIGLGALRARMGELKEAERVYSVGLAHVPSLTRAFAGRARTRRALGDLDEARRDLESYALVERDAAALRELAAWYGDDGLTPAQLAVWRRLHAFAREERDMALAREAQTMVRALQFMVSVADPVTSPVTPDATRKGIARVAKRGG